jgi:hypothetical protein
VLSVECVEVGKLVSFLINLALLDDRGQNKLGVYVSFDFETMEIL